MKIWLIIVGVLVVLYLLYRGYASQSATTSSTSAATAVPATGDLGATPTVGSSTAPTTYFPRVPKSGPAWGTGFQPRILVYRAL